MSWYDGTPPDSYWEPPEPSPGDIADELDQDLDQLVKEWAEIAEVEVFGEIRGLHYPVIVITSIRRDGDPLFDGAQEFEDSADAREWLTTIAPPLPEEE